MAAEVSADLTLIQDEDVLRRMWAETEDFGRKKEIRARMYKLREQRLKDFYTTGEVVTEITGRKHATTTHTESIGDQGFLTMKSKEIRDSESPTRDFSRRANNGYWTSMEERGYTTGAQDGSTIERSEETRKGEGMVVEGNIETRMAMSSQNLHEKECKSDDSFSVKSETKQENQAFATSVSENNENSSRFETSETQNSQLFKKEETSETSASSTKMSQSSTSSSRRVVSSSVTSNYQVTGDVKKSLTDNDIMYVTSGDDNFKFSPNFRTNEQTNIHESSRQNSTIHQDDTSNLRLQQFSDHQINENQDFNVNTSSTHDTFHDSRQHQSQHTDQTFKTHQSYITYSTTSENDQDVQWQTDIENQNRKIVDSRSNNDRVVTDSTTRNKQDIHDTENIHHESEISQSQNKIKRDSSDVSELRTNAKFDSATMKKNTVQSVNRTETSTPVEEHTVEKYTTIREVSNDNRNSSTVQSQTHSNTDQKILNEIHKLDTYLLNQNIPATSEPSTPKSVTDGAQWTIVSNRDGEFVYQNDKTPRDNKPQVTVQSKEPTKHPSSLDLPKDATDGQYLTTYQQSYNRISVDNSPSHEFFVKTLRASPDRLTPSPTKSSRGSLDRNSPDRRLRATSKGSLDRSSPENSKRRSFSKGSLDRSTPERTYRTSPSKTPDRERRGSSESYTIEKKKDSRRKTTEITQQIVRDSTNKSKRKFSSTQQKAANKTRVSTPGVSPSTSPTRNVPKKEVTSGSESDISQATYNKTSSIGSFRDERLLTSKTEKRERITDSAIDVVTPTNKSKPRDRSPEYSSEGSVCREINKSMKARSEVSAENNSFIPIKQTHIDNSNDNFILEEQINMIRDNYEEMSDSTDKKIIVNRESRNRENLVTTDVLDQVTDVDEFQLREDSVADHEEKLLKKKTSTERLVIDEKHEMKQHSNKEKSLKIGELRPKETNKPKPEKSHPKSRQEKDNDINDTESMLIKNKTSTERFITREQYGTTENVKKGKSSISSPERRPKEIGKPSPESSKPHLQKHKESVYGEDQLIENRKPTYCPETNEENKITDHVTKRNSPTPSPERQLNDTKKSSPEKTNKKPHPGEDSVDNVGKFIKNKTTVTDRLYEITEHAKKGKSPASSHEQRPKEIKKTSPESTQPKPYPGRNEQPIYNERKPINHKTSTDRLVTHEKYEIIELAEKRNSPASSPERRPKEIKKSIPETARPKSYSVKQKDSLDSECKLVKNKTLTDKLVTEEEYKITENVKKVKSPTTSPQRRPKETSKPTSETSSPKSSLEKPNDLVYCNLIKNKTITDKLITDGQHELIENVRKGKSPTSSPERLPKVTAKSSQETVIVKPYSEKPKDLVESDSKLLNNKTSIDRLVIDEQYEITEHVRNEKSPSSSPERRPKENKKSSLDATYPKTFPIRDDDLSETERNVLKTSTERLLTHEEYEITEKSPTASPERHPKEIKMSSPETSRPKSSYPGREGDSTEAGRKIFHNKTSTDRLLTHEQNELTENVKIGKAPTSSPDRRSNEIKNTRPETSYSKSYLENTTSSKVSTSRIPSSPDRKPKDLSNRQPLRQLNQKRAIDSPSVIQERKQKVLSPITQLQNKKPQQSPSNSPERRHKPVSKSSDRSVQKKTLDENRRSVSSSPERLLPQGSDVRTIKSKQTTSERFITEEKETGIRERSLSISPERTPSKLDQRMPSKKSPVSRQQRPSPSSSPERNVSPDRKVKSAQPKQNTAAPTTPVSTAQRTVQKTATKETVRTTRYSSIPRANKVSPRSSKDKIEPINKKTPTQITRRPSSVQKNQQTIKVTSVTRTTNRGTEKKEENNKPSLIKSPNISRKPVESLAKRTPTKIATPKFTPNKPKTTDSSTNNKPSVQKLNKTSPSPKIPVNKRTSHTPVKKTTKSTDEIEISEVVEFSERTTENIKLLNKERSVLDLEDENPPEEFYAEYDEKTDETGSPDRQPKSVRNLDDISLNVTTKTVPKNSKTNKETSTFNKKNQKTQETTANTTRKTSRKVKKERKIPQDSGSSSSSSSSEEEDTEQIEVLEDQTSDIIRNEQITHTSNQDLLTVVVQHPKSSRESSPGYPSAGQPFCTTSEDGESNPRYADYISEPDDVDVSDTNRGYVTPIRLTDDTIEVKSVADRVNVFLEATRMTQESVHQPEVLISSPKSVLKAKTMFENIAKNQTLSSSNQHPDGVPKSPIETRTSKYPSGHVIEQHKVSTQKEKKHGNVLVNTEIETTDIHQDITKSFIEDEIHSQVHNYVPTKEYPQPLAHTNKPNKEQPSNRKFPEKQPIGSVVDVTIRKDYFERGGQDDVEIEELKNKVNSQLQRELTDEETEEAPYSLTETTPKSTVNKQKSPSPQRQLPNAASNVTPDTKKPINRKPSGNTEIRKQLFENTTEEIEVSEQPNLKRATEDSSVRKQSSKTDITTRRSSLKEKSPSPQRNIPKQKEPLEAKKPFERKPSGHVVDVSSKKDFFERKVKDVTISAVKPTSKVKAHSPPKPKFTSPSPETQTTERGHNTKQQLHSKSTIDRSRKSITPDRMTNKQIDNEEEISETSKISYSEEIKRKFSKTEEIVTDISETELHKLKSETTGKKIPFDTEQPTRKLSKTEDTKRKVSKPEEIVRKPSKPQEIVSVPSKPDGILRSRQTEESKSHVRNESYMRGTTSSSVRGQTPEKQPNEVTRKISKPEEIGRKPSKTEEISRKPSKPEEIIRKLSKPEEIIRKPSSTEVCMKTSTTRSVDKYASEHQKNESIRKPSTSDVSDVKMPKTQDFPLITSHHEDGEHVSIRDELTDDIEISQSRAESYMRSTVSSTARGQTPEKQFRGSTPEGTVQHRPQTPIKSEDSRRPSETGEVLEETAMRRTSIRTETKQDVGGKFGVTLRKTPSASKITTKTTVQRQNSKPGETVDIESIFDLELLEEMLLKAVGYDDRRRIRAQIRIVKKQIEDEKNTTVISRITKTTSTQSTLPSVKAEKRQTSPSRSPERREQVHRSSRSTPERHEEVLSSPRSSPERRVKSGSPEKQSPERSPVRRISTEKVLTNGYKESRKVTETTTVRTQSVKKSATTDIKETCPTDLITSSYGVGPTDENGKPLFGLRALRRTSTNKTLIDETIEHETVTEEEEGSSLFGLKALQTENMPAESGQLRELVERHQQYVRESSAKDLQPVQKPKAKLRDSFILTQDDDSTSVLNSGTDDTHKGLSLKSIIQKHENNTGSNVQTSMERKSTVVKSHSTVSSDGKVSVHRDVIHGEVSSKNNEEPVGKITRSSYSYQSPRGKDSVPSVTSSTTTSLIGSRRSSGPKIEEITDSSSFNDINRRYSKEYTVEEAETVLDQRRTSGFSAEENVKTYTSILKNSNETGRRLSGPRITDVSDVNTEHGERKTSVTKTISSRASPDIQESQIGFSNRQQNLKREERTETPKKVVTRGDSVKALQHKFQQATEAANQPTSRPYPRAGLILRSNTLQHIDDQTQTSSSIKHSSVERSSSKSKQETKLHDAPSSPVLKTEVITQEDSEVVETTQISRPEEPTSFLDNRTKVTGVQDILTRMRNADLVTEKTDSSEDAEARALLNKFLGASVILQGMEQGMRAAQTHPDSEGPPTAPSSAALVIQAEKQRVKATAVRTVEDDIDDINDEKQLRILLDACSDYEGRRKLRARLRTIMAEQKGGSEDVEESHECSESSSEVVRKGDSIVKTEVHSRTTTSSARLTKANSVQSPFAKFRQLERQNSAPRTSK